MTTRRARENEESLLLPKNVPLEQPTQGGSATFQETVVNLTKLCMGTGTLALPFAAQKGGLILNVFGLIGIAGWNLFSAHRLILALRIYEKNDRLLLCPEKAKTSIFSKIGWLAFGEIGIHLLDVCLVTLFLGIVVSYEDAAVGFLQDTPLSTASLELDAFVIATMVGFLSLAPDMSDLAKASASGLFVLAFTFIIVAIYGTTSGKTLTVAIDLWPQGGLTGVSDWFGCAVFGFGTVPLTYSYYESMREPSRLIHAKALAFSGVLVSYLVTSYGLLLLYPIVMDGDILEDILPTIGVVPTVVRLAMIVVIVLTSPLIVLPCGVILEGKIQSIIGGRVHSWSRLLQVVVRSSICIAAAVISISTPGFVYILSFVGCCAVSLVSFVVPPLLHIALVCKYEDVRSKIATILLDVVMLIWGISAMTISSTYTFKKLQSNL